MFDNFAKISSRSQLLIHILFSCLPPISVNTILEVQAGNKAKVDR